MEIKEYKILSSSSQRRLQADVNIAISNGWQPLGGVSCYYHKHKISSKFYNQAMIKQIK